MYLKDGREILPCEEKENEGYWFEANTGNFCDEHGNLVGGNKDMGDRPGRQNAPAVILDVPDYVYISKSGKLFYPNKTATATKRIKVEEAEAKGYKPSRGYQAMLQKLYKEHLKKQKKGFLKKNKNLK